MKAGVIAVRDALAELTDIEIHALTVAANEAPRLAHGLLDWIEGACDWELCRRAGRHYDLLPPEAAIDPSEDAASLEAIHAIRASFVASDLAPAVLKFFDVVVNLLTGGRRKA